MFRHQGAKKTTAYQLYYQNIKSIRNKTTLKMCSEPINKYLLFDTTYYTFNID